MSALLHWFTSPEWAQAVKALLHSLWQGAAIALVLAVVLRRLRDPVSRYRSSLAALTAIIFATVITWAIINGPSRTQLPAHTPPLIAQPPPPDSTIAPEPNLSPRTPILVAHKSTNIRWTAWLAFTWLVGAVLMLARAGFKVAGAEKLRRSCRPLDDPRIETLLAETRRALGIANRIRVGVTDKLTSPAVVGVVVPMLILPLALLTTLTPDQIRFVLLHELAHIRRRDYLANLFQFLAESLLFFNPAVWWISHQIRREREACCDALATELSGAPGDYAHTLVQVAETILYAPPAAAPAFGTKRDPSTLAERIQRLLVPGYRPSLQLTWRAMLAALIIGGILLFSSALGTRLTVAAVLTNPPNDVKQERMNSDTKADSTNLYTRSFQIDSNALHRLAEEDGKQSVADDLLNMHKNILFSSEHPPLFTFTKPAKLAGVTLVAPEGVMYNQKAGVLTVKATATDLPIIAAALEKFLSTSPRDTSDSGPAKAAHGEQIETARLVQDGKLMFQLGKLDEAEAKLNEALKREPDNQAALYYLSRVKQNRARIQTGARNLPNASIYARPNVIYTSSERQRVYEKLNDIRFDKIAFPNLPLGEVVRILTEQVERSDLDKEGINFVISKTKPEAVSPNSAQPAFDPTTGQPIVPAPTEDVDLSSVQISVDPELRNVRLMDVLEAIVKTADHPIKYSILDYGIEFSFKGPETPALFTRTFKVDPNTFFMGLTNWGFITPSPSIPRTRGLAGGTSEFLATGNTNHAFDDITYQTQVAVINLFASAGVNLAPPKAAFFNDRRGTLTVRATAADLDLVEAAIDKLNVAPQQVSIKARFVQLQPGSDSWEEMDWLMLARLTNGSQIFTGNLTSSQFQNVLQKLEHRDGADLINEAQITTLTGRQAQFQVVDSATVDTNTGTATITNGTGESITVDINSNPFGTTLDVVPMVSDDRSTIQITLIPTVTEFLGTNQFPTGRSMIVDIPITGPLPLPRGRVRQITLNTSVKDGRTLVLGGFPGKPNGIMGTNLLIFVTPTLIDSFGHRLHSADYYDSPVFQGSGEGGGGFGGGFRGGGQ